MKKSNKNTIVFRKRIGEQLSIFEDGETEYLYSEKKVYTNDKKLKRRKPENEV